MLKITPIPAFTDNYIWAISHNHQLIVVDPGASAPVQRYLQDKQMQLSGILVTHWHPDHTGGIAELVRQYAVPVYGPQSEHIPDVTQVLADGDTIEVLDIQLQVLAVPGHTLDHLAYYSEEAESLFCGDTLFAAGCGRVFEGTAAMMLSSLEKLAKLPERTFIYCAHEYTLSNLRFALEVEPDNQALQQRLIDCEKLRAEGKVSLPSTLNEELMTNPFLRVQEESVITQALNQGAHSASAVDVFSCLREWKNHF